MKFKVKTKDCQLLVKAKISFGESIDQKEIDRVSRIILRGFLKPQVIKKNHVEFKGPVAVSLYDKLKKNITKKEFLMILEQIVVTLRNMSAHAMMMNHLVLDLQYVFINNVTKELLFIYLPAKTSMMYQTLTQFIESIVYSAKPVDERDGECISRFIYYYRSLKSFDMNQIEKFIAKEDKNIVKNLQRQNGNQSGFITDKQRDYHEHYNPSNKVNNPGSDPTELLKEVEFGPTDLLEKNDYKDESVHRNVGSEPTGLLEKNDKRGSSWFEDEATGLLIDIDNESCSYLDVDTEELDETDELTGLLVDEKHNYEKTGKLTQEEDDYWQTAPLNQIQEEDDYWQTATLNRVQDEDEGTGLLINNDMNVHFASLYRVLTEETISVNKPVFRLGKERSYVDYFVTNNILVSRGHADIITRGSKYFVKDLNSKNHTFINDQVIPIQCEIEIFDGDRLKLGNEEFIFHV